MQNAFRGLVVSLAATVAVSGAFAQTPAPAALRAHGGPVKSMALIENGTVLVTGSFDSTIIVWDLKRRTAKRVLRFHGSTVTALAAIAGDCFASGGEDALVAIWCGDSTTPKTILEGHTAPVTQLAVSPDRKTLASVSFDRTVRLWPVEGGASRTLDTQAAPLNALAFLKDGSSLVTGSYDGTTKRLPLDRSVPTAMLNLEVPVNAAVVTADNRILIAGADGHVRVLSPELKVVADIDVGNGPLTSLAVTPDSTIVAAAGMRTPVTLINLATLEKRTEILGPGLPVWTLAFTADGADLFTGGQDQVIRRWATQTGAAVGPDEGNPAEEVLPFPTERGAQVFAACRACHSLKPDDRSKAGPTLSGLFGRRIGTLPGYDYSAALRKMDIVWTPQTVSALFTEGPLAYTPGTKMPEQRITNSADRTALVDWLAKASLLP
jgi:cytochrome c